MSPRELYFFTFAHLKMRNMRPFTLLLFLIMLSCGNPSEKSNKKEIDQKLIESKEDEPNIEIHADAEGIFLKQKRVKKFFDPGLPPEVQDTLFAYVGDSLSLTLSRMPSGDYLAGQARLTEELNDEFELSLRTALAKASGQTRRFSSSDDFLSFVKANNYHLYSTDTLNDRGEVAYKFSKIVN